MTGSGLHVGIDVGGTKCLGVALDADGNLVGRGSPADTAWDGSVDRLIDTFVELAASLGIVRRRSVSACRVW